MRIFKGFDHLPEFSGTAVTVGSFDGVHRGHLFLLERLLEEARKNQSQSVVLTFDPHPRVTLHRDEGLHILTSLEEKALLLEQAGVDNLVVIPFDERFCALSGEEFVREYLIRKLGAKTLVAGFNHRFGHDRCDCSSLPESLLKVVRVTACDVDGVRVSSTVIRNLLDAGRRAEAEKLLGHSLETEFKE